MQLKIPHKFTQAQAIEKVKAALNDGRAQIAGKATIEKEEWQGNILTFAFTAEGQHIEGTLTVLEHEFDVEATLPLMLRMFEGRIQKMIEQQAQRVLG